MTAAASHQLLAGQNDKFLLNRYYLKNITLADVNSAFHTMTAVKSRLVMITHPEKIQPQAMDAAALEKTGLKVTGYHRKMGPGRRTNNRTTGY